MEQVGTEVFKARRGWKLTVTRIAIWKRKRWRGKERDTLLIMEVPGRKMTPFAFLNNAVTGKSTYFSFWTLFSASGINLAIADCLCKSGCAKELCFCSVFRFSLLLWTTMVSNKRNREGCCPSVILKKRNHLRSSKILRTSISTLGEVLQQILPKGMRIKVE